MIKENFKTAIEMKLNYYYYCGHIESLLHHLIIENILSSLFAYQEM